MIYLKELLDMPLNQLHHIILPLRLPVAEIDPGRDRQTKLRRHDLWVRVYKPPLTNEKTHKPGEVAHDIPHGTANALLFPYVCRFNAQRHPYKMGTFSQYKYPQAFERYVELGELIGVKGKTDEQTFENWIKACQQLNKDLDIPETNLDWLLEAHPEKSAEEWEAEFLAAVDQMSEWAFHDACTGCNPVYPTIGELKGCYLKAFYGEKKYTEKYGDTWEVPVTLPTDTHAAYPMGLSADLGVAKTGGFN